MTSRPQAALGQWTKAPLALVVAQVRLNSFTDLASIAVPFGERIGKDYPRIQPMQQLISAFPGAEGPTPEHPNVTLVGHSYSNAENTKSVRLELGAITYAVSAYAQYAGHFEEEWRALVEAASSVKELFITRIGLRYVDFILPKAGAVPEDYVATPLGRAPNLAQGKATVAFNLFNYEMPEGSMRVQFGRSEGRPDLPPDLVGLQLAPSPVMVREFTAEAAAILDIDRSMQPELSLPADEIMSRFATMHNDMSKAFKRIITERAKKDWGAK